MRKEISMKKESVNIDSPEFQVGTPEGQARIKAYEDDDRFFALIAACRRAVSALAANGAPNCEAAKECRAALARFPENPSRT